MDEASAIEPIIWETLEGAVTDADAEVVWVAAGNPLHSSGRFREIWGKYQHRWITRQIDSRSVSFTNKVELQSQQGRVAEVDRRLWRGQ
jgi:hypothetical protein